MDKVAPAGPFYQAGTLSGNPLAMTAGIETLKILQEAGTYQRLEALAARLADGLLAAAKAAEVPVYGTRVGSVMTLFFAKGPVTDYASARTADTGRFATYFRAMLEQGVYLAPSQFEAAFVSLAHTDEDVSLTLNAAEKAFRAVRTAASS